MSRISRGAAVLDAAERWKQRCLVDGGSLLGEERLWTSEHFGELQTYFVEQPDETRNRSFLEKLRDQLAPCAAGGQAAVGGNDVGVLPDRELGQRRNQTRPESGGSGSGRKPALPEDHWALAEDVLDRGNHPTRAGPTRVISGGSTDSSSG